MKLSIEKEDLVFIPENDSDCFHLGQLSKNVASCTQVYVNDVAGSVAKFQKLLVHKNSVLDILCRGEK